MRTNIITKQLANKLPKESKLLKHNIVNPKNFNQTYQLLASNRKNEIYVTDSTATTAKQTGKIIPIKDHINRTGTNILRGKQKFLNIDFIDISNLYNRKQNSIITDCCGETLNDKYEYPSHYICHIITLAYAMNIKNIHGFLYNSI